MEFVIFWIKYQIIKSSHNRDSIEGTMELLPSLPAFSFIHIDPYEIDKPAGTNGSTYLDVFLKAAQMGMK